MKRHSLFKLFAATMASAILAACQSEPRYEVFTVPALAVLPPDRRESVWYPDQIAPYSVGRYVDPRDHDVVHEAHTIYRREQTSRPNLTPPEALVFPPVASGSASNAAVMLRDALTAELNQQRAASRALIEQAQTLDKVVRQLNTQTQESRDAIFESARVRSQLLAISNRLEILEGHLRVTPSTPGGPLPQVPSNSSAHKP